MQQLSRIIFLLIGFLGLNLSESTAQVAINTDGSNPDASAILDLKSTSKGLLIPRMNTAQRTALPNTIGLSVYDTDLKTPMFNNGTGWEPGSFGLPYSASHQLNASAPVFQIISTGINAFSIMGESTTNGTGIYGKSPNGYGVRGVSESNIGVYGYTVGGTAGYFQSALSSGAALAISGKMISNGTSGSVGSVLSVNTSGYPLWQEPIAFAVNDLGASDVSIPHNVDTKLVFAAEEYDLGNDFNLVNSDFTAPVKGIYHFDAFAYWIAHTNGTGLVAISILKNNALYASTRQPAFINEAVSNGIGVNMLLNSGDKVTVVAYQNSGVAQSVFQDGRLVKFSGYLVYRQ